MQKVYISLFIVVLFSCCTSSSSKEEELECSVEINNKDLIEAITEYQERERNLQRGFLVCGPDYCYLTFLGDSLIDKTFKHGMSRDKIPVKLNGKEVYL